LCPAGSIGDGVIEKDIAQRVKRYEVVRTEMSGGHERQRTIPCLPDHRARKTFELIPSGHLTELHGGLETRRVREATGGKRGISQLPQ
jgi:hypothetical protein